ncbi:uS2 family ribosomal protein, partial [Endozoicomonas sp. SESOKO4]|uniref:uS2 family ribosomal protein n=1 Tax=Endozoicomonas sp. SESOKO4 TaxID=2828745 RepID=UPI0021482098
KNKILFVGTKRAAGKIIRKVPLLTPQNGKTRLRDNIPDQIRHLEEQQAVMQRKCSHAPEEGLTRTLL